MNTARAAGAGRTRAAPIARPINGPLQGVAMKAVSAPVQNAPPAPSRIINPPPIEIEGNSNMPTRLKVMIAIRAVSERITYGFCNWKAHPIRSEEHTSELQSLMRISYAVFCLKKKKKNKKLHTQQHTHEPSN